MRHFHPIRPVLTAILLASLAMAQVRQSPPTFLLFVNRDELFSDSYKKNLAGEMRTAFGYEGCPIVLVPKPRPKSVEPIRKFKDSPGKSQSRSPIRRLNADRKHVRRTVRLYITKKHIHWNLMRRNASQYNCFRIQ